MIFAVSVPEKCELVICGADTLINQRDFLTDIADNHPHLLQDTDCGRFFTDPDLARFKNDPPILEFPDQVALEAFINAGEFELVSFPNGAERQRGMFDKELFEDTSGRTIGEVTGLDEFDPFDHRTEEEKAEYDKKVEEAKKKRKSGDLTGDSWGAPQRSRSEGEGADDDEHAGGLQIRDMNVTVDDDGNIVVGRVTADKDLFKQDYYKVVVRENGETLVGKEAYEPILKRAGLADNSQNFGADYRVDPEGGILIQLAGASLMRMQGALEDLDHDIEFIYAEGETSEEFPLRIADDQMVEIYYRVEAETELSSALAWIGTLKRPAYKAADFATGGCWLAYVRRGCAEDVVDILAKNGVESKIVEVDYKGIRIIEEGVDYATVIDTEAENIEPGLPWNDRADEFYALDEKERKKVLQGKWIAYSIRKFDYPTGLIIHLTPLSHFRDNETLWEGDFPIDHLIPDNLTKFGDKVGVYQCKSLDLNTCDFILGNKLGMRESLLLRSVLNSMGKKAFE